MRIRDISHEINMTELCSALEKPYTSCLYILNTGIEGTIHSTLHKELVSRAPYTQRFIRNWYQEPTQRY